MTSLPPNLLEGATLSNAHALVDKLSDSVAEVDVETLGDTLRDAQALVDELADSLAEFETETLDNTLSDAQQWSGRWQTR